MTHRSIFALLMSLALAALAIAVLAAPSQANGRYQARPEFASLSGAAPSYPCFLPPTMGDVSGTGEVDAADAMWILSHIALLPLPEGGQGCSPHDADCDGDEDAVDALWILRWIVHLPVYQVEPCPDIGTEL